MNADWGRAPQREPRIPLRDPRAGRSSRPPPLPAHSSALHVATLDPLRTGDYRLATSDTASVTGGGRRHAMTVAAILRAKGTHVETTTPETTLFAATWNLKIKGIGALVVVSGDRNHILGIISERDIIRALIEHRDQLLALPVSKAMTSPVLTFAREDRVTAVMARMTRHRVRHLPVVEGGKLAGIISIGDVVKYRLDELELEAHVLRATLF